MFVGLPFGLVSYYDTEKQSHASCSRSHARCSFRSFTEQASLRSYIDALHIDEKALAGAVKPLLKAQDGDFRAKLSRCASQRSAFRIVARVQRADAAALLPGGTRARPTCGEAGR